MTADDMISIGSIVLPTHNCKNSVIGIDSSWYTFNIGAIILDNIRDCESRNLGVVSSQDHVFFFWLHNLILGIRIGIVGNGMNFYVSPQEMIKNYSIPHIRN